MTKTLTTDELRQIVDSHEKGYGMSVPIKINYGYLAARELLANREAQSVPTGKFAGWGLYHAGRDDFGSWLKHRPEEEGGDAITKHGYVNVKLFTAPPAPANPQPVEVTDEMALAFHRALNDGGIGESDLEEIKVGLRGALCNITAPAVASGENCWSCSKFFTYAQHSECDGYCPHCNAPVDLDEEEPDDEA